MKDEPSHNLLMDFVSSAEKNQAGSYVESFLKVVRSWLAHNRR